LLDRECLWRESLAEDKLVVLQRDVRNLVAMIRLYSAKTEERGMEEEGRWEKSPRREIVG
jgi:hypothetical protein